MPTGASSPDPAPAAEVAQPEALVITRWFDSGDAGEPYRATVRFTGRRAGVQGKPTTRDSFVQDETIERVVPGSGPVSITAWVSVREPGEWAVNAELVPYATGLGGSGVPHSRRGRPTPLHPAGWSWRRWGLSTGASPLVKTRLAMTSPLARIPAVVPGSLPVLAIVGALIALATQAAILTDEGVPVARALPVALIAAGLGLLGAKLWYAALHPAESMLKAGWAVDGFLIVSPIAATIALLAFNLPIGAYLDASAPGLFFAVAIGRLGCFFTGCCAGRCTRSRWGVWSSDRRVGARRIPTQLLEAAAGLSIGLATLPLLRVATFHGAILVAAFALYVGVRQLLLRLRAEQRTFRRSLSLTAAAATLVLLTVTAVVVAYPRHPAHMLSVANPSISRNAGS